MILRKIYLLLTLVILIGCNQSDSPSVENSGTKQSKSTLNDSTSAVETEPERTGKVLARVNGQPIYEDRNTQADPEFFITEEILYQAYQEGLIFSDDKSAMDKVRDFERSLIISTAKQRILENAEPTKEVSSEDIENYYESNKDKYKHVIVNEISFPEKALGSEIKDKVKSGEGLQDIANSYPDIPIIVSGIAYNRAMDQHFTAIEVGSVSEVIKKPDGRYSVLKIVELKEIPLKVLTRSIKHLLTAQRKSQMFNSYAQKIAEENNMTIEIIEQDSEQ